MQPDERAVGSNCRHRNRTLTGRIRPICWPPKREYKCNQCNELHWMSFFPRAYMDILAMQHELPYVVDNKHLSIGGMSENG